MTNVYFVGNGPSAFAFSDGSWPNLAIAHPSWYYYRTNWVNCAIAAGIIGDLNGNNTSCMTPRMPLPTSFWVHQQIHQYSNGYNNGSFFKIYDSSNVCRIIAYTNSNLTISLYKCNAAGTVTLLVTGSLTWALDAQQEINLQITYSTNGSITFYGPSGIIMATYSGDITTDGISSLSGGRVGFNPGGTAYLDYYGNSEFLVQDTDTRGVGVLVLPITDAGDINTFDNGTYTSVNSSGLNDSAYITSLTSGEKFLGKITTSIPSGFWTIPAIAITSRVNVGTGGGPQHYAPLLKTNDGSTWTGTTVTASSAYFDNHTQILSNNPHTSNAWAPSDLVSLQVGIMSVT